MHNVEYRLKIVIDKTYAREGILNKVFFLRMSHKHDLINSCTVLKTFHEFFQMGIKRFLHANHESYLRLAELRRLFFSLVSSQLFKYQFP